MTEIDYKAAVLNVYPDAEECNNANLYYYASHYWISDEDGIRISNDCNTASEAWKSAYERLNKTT